MQKLGIYLFHIYLIFFSVTPGCPFETIHLAELDPPFFIKTKLMVTSCFTCVDTCVEGW